MTVDLRLATGQPFKGKQLVKVSCPFHDDMVDSMLVDSDHLYCPACRKFIRCQAGLALLLGKWDGKPETELAAVNAVRGLLSMYESKGEVVKPRTPKPLDLHAPGVFHAYMLTFQRDRMERELKEKRGLTDATIGAFTLGHTGSHFSIPVYDEGKALLGIRFRADDKYTCSDTKYSGLVGHNERQPYPLWNLRGAIAQLWITEGEYDAIRVEQEGVAAQTLTNGAGVLAELPGILQAKGYVVDQWIIASDQDAAGEEAAYQLRTVLNGTSRRARWQVGYKDIGELLAAGACISDVELVIETEHSIWDFGT